ncbi:MAG: hypothetical protein DMD98_19800, partial [Candidatus Rokuibacteriota bacterium]
MAPNGSFYIADSGNNRIRGVGPDGIITTVAGNGTAGFSGDGGPAAQASLNFPNAVAVAPAGGFYIADVSNHRIRRVVPVLPGFSGNDFGIASEDGNEFYLFSFDGRHRQTVNGLTGAVLYQFAYDADGRLAAVTDGNDNVTTIERDTGGNPTAIVSPFGQRTTLTADANGYLSRVANPAGEAVQMAYTADGLLTRFT